MDQAQLDAAIAAFITERVKQEPVTIYGWFDEDEYPPTTFREQVVVKDMQGIWSIKEFAAGGGTAYRNGHPVTVPPGAVLNFSTPPGIF